MEHSQDMAWYAWEWLTWSRLMSFSWQHAWVLYALCALPAFLTFWLLSIGRTRVSLSFTQHQWKDFKQWSTYLRYLTGVLICAVWIFLCLALARPQRSGEWTEKWQEGIDILLAIDVSGSMGIEDFKPNRLEAAKEVAKNFIKQRKSDRIGLVVFSGEAFSKTPLTGDHDLLLQDIGSLNLSMIENLGTAIGSALAVSTNRMRDSKSKSKVIILLSDGQNTAGEINPLTAAKLAEAFHIKIYTLGIGKSGRVPFGKDPFGRTAYVYDYLDETVLKEIANIGKGKFYRVTNERALQRVFDEIDELEKSEIKEKTYKEHEDYYPIYLKWALSSFLFLLLCKSTFVSNILND